MSSFSDLYILTGGDMNMTLLLWILSLVALFLCVCVWFKFYYMRGL